MESNELKPLREEIDKLDVRILQLINERMALVKEVGRIKARRGLALFDPSREEAIYDRLSKVNAGPLTNASVRAIYREIMAASRLLQYRLRVAFVGPEWTYSHLAAISLYGHSAEYLPMTVLEDVFDAVLKGKAHVGVVPIENSLEGGVGRTIDLMYEMDLKVVQECYFEVAYYLAGGREAPEGGITRIYGHPQGFAQCRGWLLENYRKAEWHECVSTAQAAQQARSDPSSAAICNLYAAHHYGLRVLYERIEDSPGNVTRFFALAPTMNPPTENDKTSVLFALPDNPGALHAALEPFVKWHVNMTRIESRPNRLFPWQYVFYAEIEGHSEAKAVRYTLNALREHAKILKILGSYPKSDPKRPIRVEKEEVRTNMPGGNVEVSSDAAE